MSRSGSFGGGGAKNLLAGGRPPPIWEALVACLCLAIASGCGSKARTTAPSAEQTATTVQALGGAANGSTCAQATDCASGFCSVATCAACSTDGNCQSGQYCNSGSCAALIATGQPGCHTAQDCVVGDRCD